MENIMKEDEIEIENTVTEMNAVGNTENVDNADNNENADNFNKASYADSVDKANNADDAGNADSTDNFNKVSDGDSANTAGNAYKADNFYSENSSNSANKIDNADNDVKFEDLGISAEILRGLEDMGFTAATPIQSQAIPVVMQGGDVIGQAQTGTGKTCAYGIPAIEMCDRDARSAQVLVLCPTRELAIQVADELKKVSKYTHGVRIMAIYGGQHIETQISALRKKPQIIIGTPGRIMDHLRRRTLKFNDLKMVVLDEADEMLNMGFREDIDTILEDVPEEKQMMLFSATMPPEIMSLTKKYQKNPAHIKIAKKELTVELIDQYFIEVREASKLELLCRLIDVNNVNLGLVFCNTKRRVDDVTARLQDRGYAADALHGDMKQNERDRVMNKFRHGITQILVATDVAARGIDVSGVEAVFNYDIPEDPEQYVHRIGRTGRAGNAGKSYSFVFGRDMYKLREIMRYTKSHIERAKPPTINEVEAVRTTAAADRVKQMAMAGEGEKYLSVVGRIISEAEKEGSYISPNDVAAALFKLAFIELEEKDYERMDFDDEEFEYSKLDMVRLFVNAGRLDGLKEAHLVKGIASRTSLAGKMIGSIELHKNFSFVDVPRQYVDEVMESMLGFTHGGRGIAFEVAEKKKRGSKGNSAKRKESSNKRKDARKSERKDLRKSERKDARKSEHKDARKSERKDARKSEHKDARKPECKDARKSERKDARKSERKGIFFRW